MKNTAITIIVLLAAFAASIVLERKAVEQRIADRDKDLGKAYVTRDKRMSAGFDAAVADFTWMQTYLRSSPRSTKGMDEEAKKTMLERAAKQEFMGYFTVVQLDPTFAQAYRFGILRLMMDLPKESLEMADRAMLFCKDSKKEFAELAAHISAKVQKDNEQALKYLKICIEGGPGKDYLGRQYLRTLVRLKNLDPYNEDLGNLYQMLLIYEKEYLEQSKPMTVAAPPAQEAGQGQALPPQRDEMTAPTDTWLKPVLMKACSDFLAKANREKDRAKASEVAHIKRLFDSLKPAGNLCAFCYRPSDAGDAFCPACGTKVAVHGACDGCGTVLKGGFCHKCGKAAPKPAGLAEAPKPPKT